MKKLSILVITSLLIFGLFAACGEAPSEMETFSSDHGYTVAYPAKYEPTSLSSNIDFVLFDEQSGTNVNIISQIKKEDVINKSSDDFIAELADAGMDIRLISYKTEKINDTNAVVAEYIYNENVITQILYDASDNTYSATYTELPGTRDDVAEELLAVIRSLRV